jgi:ankyrin repeat protein
LAAKPQPEQLLTLAASHPDPAAVRMLLGLLAKTPEIELGASVTASGGTILHHVAAHGMVHAAEALLESDANRTLLLDATDRCGRTPLLVAIAAEHVRMVGDSFLLPAWLLAGSLRFLPWASEPFHL